MGKYIYYTTIDDTIIEDRHINYSGYGANIISHTYNNGLGVIEFDGDVTAIPDGFCGGGDSGPVNLKTIKFPNTIKNIGYRVIRYENFVTIDKQFLYEVDLSECTELETIGGDFISAGYHGSDYCMLKEIDLSNCNKLSSIGEHFLDYVKSIRTIKWPKNGPDLSIGQYLASECGIEVFEMPRNLVKWEYRQMNNWSNINTIIIPSGVYKLNLDTFGGTSHLVKKIMLSTNAEGDWYIFTSKFPNAEVIMYEDFGDGIEGEINRLNVAKERLRNSIMERKIDVPENLSISYYPYFIEKIGNPNYSFYIELDGTVHYPSSYEVIEVSVPKSGDRVYTNITSSGDWYVDEENTVLNGGFIQTKTGRDVFNIDLPTVYEYTENRVCLRRSAFNSPLIIVYKQG